ncbi:MAG: alkaline phosphatase [Vicinamibacteria bacterium]|jgi:alkaline phosphatase|nr:alkaline phosphatase [Vicinamibacteria bacterium]
MRRTVITIICLGLTSALHAEPRAKNVILFLGDAAGIPTLSAVGVAAGRPQGLALQHLPQVALMETSSASHWVTDSAAGITAIVTGEKTNNRVLSQAADAMPLKKDGRALKTILEYAEERGLSTGVITNSALTSATPAGLYAHVNDRGLTAEIVAQMFRPRFGNGADVMIGNGRQEATAAAQKAQIDWIAAARAHGYETHDRLDPAIPRSARHIYWLDDEAFDLALAVRIATEILARNPKGYLLLVESDLHADDWDRCQHRTLAFDALIAETAARADESRTLVVFAADHSYDLRMTRGLRGGELTLASPTSVKHSIAIGTDHTGEDVLVSAAGPGSALVRGSFPNTRLFSIMMAAYGWKPDTVPAKK